MTTIDPELSASHKWLAEVDPKLIKSLLSRDTTHSCEKWVRDLHWLTDGQLLAAFDDPRIPGLYVPEPPAKEKPKEIAGYVSKLTANGEMEHIAIKPLFTGHSPAKTREQVIGYLMRVRSYEQAKAHVVGEDISIDPRFLGFERTSEQFIELSRTYFGIENLGGKFLVGKWYGNELILQSRDQFIQAHEHVRMRGEGLTAKGIQFVKEAEVAREWLKWPSRKMYSRVEFAPGLDVPDNVLNLFRGFGVEPSSGEGRNHMKFLTFVHDVICDGNEAAYEYVVHWMARAAQFPHKPGETVLVLKSPEEGTGKGFFANQFGHLFGHHFFKAESADQVLGRFNDHLRRTILLFADEAFFVGDRKQANKLKSFVTDPTLAYEGKFKGVENDRNCLHIIMASNEAHVVRADKDARRFMVLNVNPKHKGDRDYFADIEDSLIDGGYRDLMACLLNVDLSRWKPQPVVQTKGLQEQKDMTAEDSWYGAIERLLHAAGANEVSQATDDEGRMDEVDVRHPCRIHTEALLCALGVPTARQTDRDYERLRKVLPELGFNEANVNMRIDGVQAKGYRRNWDGEGLRVTLVWQKVYNHARNEDEWKLMMV